MHLPLLKCQPRAPLSTPATLRIPNCKNYFIKVAAYDIYISPGGQLRSDEAYMRGVADKGQAGRPARASPAFGPRARTVPARRCRLGALMGGPRGGSNGSPKCTESYVYPSHFGTGVHYWQILPDIQTRNLRIEIAPEPFRLRMRAKSRDRTHAFAWRNHGAALHLGLACLPSPGIDRFAC